jgi:hypothetical protein
MDGVYLHTMSYSSAKGGGSHGNKSDPSIMYSGEYLNIIHAPKSQKQPTMAFIEVLLILSTTCSATEVPTQYA